MQKWKIYMHYRSFYTILNFSINYIVNKKINKIFEYIIKTKLFQNKMIHFVNSKWKQWIILN